ncbi:hypothetical protein Gasu2_22850 [Galdieria sulphuraria]|uniref:Uncharacterized protein n=1 Tax=Galdieria sulphuraria TaxID=130081 RepID=M2X085_GALSU|nr:uncharacterized protein Gasu_29580 [Galdieria sulphuraria]EME29740.1 hypothetical protein Gasu_29580 [Galdieria sulphuraria]GJD07967.1 hypothetical protein Gasu2_22850 [Galdieria sulphuraria]|eukprot:XP_005706260.1 hypothetical protein Gasu_29580 [Galdieria sulphuraria]
MGCAISREVQTVRKKQRPHSSDLQIQSVKSASKDVASNILEQNFTTKYKSTEITKRSDSQGTTVEDDQVSMDGASNPNRTLSKRISDKVEYFEQLTRRISEEPTLRKRNSAYSKWKIEELPQRNPTAPIDWEHVPKERLVTIERGDSASIGQVFAEDARICQRVTSWRDVIQQLRDEHFRENYSLDKSLKRRSSKLGA